MSEDSQNQEITNQELKEGNPPDEIGFGDIFSQEQNKDNKLFVALNVKYAYIESTKQQTIIAAEIMNTGIDPDKLSWPGNEPLDKVHSISGNWDKKRIIEAYTRKFGGKLPESLSRDIDLWASQPKQKIKVMPEDKT